MADDTRDPTYFGYYAQFIHQQNMLQDTVRTSAYSSAVQSSPFAFQNKLVLDLGAGSGILSFFAVKAGAKTVYAVEASGMAERVRKILKEAESGGRNGWLKGRLVVVNSKIERPNLPISPVDTLISEPIGVLLLHERMIESYLVARDKYLKPGGTMIPSNGTIHLAPFCDSNLYALTMQKVRFWDQRDFYGVDFSVLTNDAKDEIFGQPVVGTFDHRILLGPSVTHFIDFETISIPQIQDIIIPIHWDIAFTGLIHGIAGWFDITLGQMILSTAPNADRTHWQQVRFVLKEPIAVNAFQTVKGWLRMRVNDQRSYTIEVELSLNDNLSDPTKPFVALPNYPILNAMPGEKSEPVADKRILYGTRRGKWNLHEQTYWYSNDPVNNFPEYNSMYEPELLGSEGSYETAASAVSGDIDVGSA